MTNRCVVMIGFAILAASAMLAQENQGGVAPAKAADVDPPLDVTMQFIADKILQQEKVNYAVYGHDSSNNSDWVNEFAYETTNVKAITMNFHPVQCSMNYHRSLTKDGRPQIIDDTGFKLAAVQDVEVMTLEQAVDESDAEVGHPARNSKVNPPAWVLRVRGKADGVGEQNDVKQYHALGNDLDVAITRNVAGDKYHYRLDFPAPPAKRIASSDSVQIYGFRRTVTGANPAPPIPTASGRWLPGDPVHLEFDVIKQFTDSSSGWDLHLCIGTRSLCIPSTDLLEVKPPRTYEFLFHDEETANRVAKAMLHAVELCGGGSRPEPF